MNTTDITTLLAMVATLSVASQKLTEIFKAWIPGLKAPEPPPANPADDLKRQRWVQVASGVAGVVTAWASWPVISGLEFCKQFAQSDSFSKALMVIVIGLMASGSSGPWNDLTTWLKNLKESSKPAAR